jgi:hypothetical protein
MLSSFLCLLDMIPPYAKYTVSSNRIPFSTPDWSNLKVCRKMHHRTNGSRHNTAV